MSVKLISDTEIYSFDEIMAAPDMEPVPVAVPEWGGKSVLIRPMTTGESMETLKVGQRPDGSLDIARYSQELLAASLIKPAVTDEQAADMVARRSAHAIQRVVKAIQELNVTDEEAKKALQAEFPDQPAPEL